jgi:hypothetical protein
MSGRVAVWICFLSLAAPACTYAAEPMPIGALEPTVGASVPLTLIPGGGSYLSPLFTFRFDVGVTLNGGERFLQRFSLCVSTEATTSEGRLSGTCIGRGEPSIAGGEAVWRPSGPWTDTPGAYYWQPIAVTREITAAGERLYEYVGPVNEFSLVLPATAPPAPLSDTPAGAPAPTTWPMAALSLTETYSFVKQVIALNARAPHHLRDSCYALDGHDTHCEASWLSALHPTSQTMVYAGAFGFAQSEGTVAYAFIGTRGTYGCYRRHSGRHCNKPVRWEG